MNYKGFKIRQETKLIRDWVMNEEVHIAFNLC